MLHSKTACTYQAWALTLDILTTYDIPSTLLLFSHTAVQFQWLLKTRRRLTFVPHPPPPTLTFPLASKLKINSIVIACILLSGGDKVENLLSAVSAGNNLITRRLGRYSQGRSMPSQTQPPLPAYRHPHPSRTLSGRYAAAVCAAVYLLDSHNSRGP